MAISKSSTLFVAAIILSITVCQVSCMRHHHVERRAGDASKDMAKEECDMIANDMLQKYKDKPYTEARDPFLDFFKKCIIQLFDFQMEANPEDKDKENYVLFKNLPTFVEKPYEEFSPLTKNFGLYAKVIETFFTKAGEWNTLLKDDKMKTDKGILVVCKNLLYAVGARYAYYTYLLRHITTSDVSLCKVDPDDKIYKPLEMCYPVQTGPVMCTSDVEFGLVGKEAGTAVLQYNKYIATQRCDAKGTQKPCNAETMLDGLIRADALEIAAPDIFLPTNPSDKGQVAKLEKQKKILASLDKSYYMKWFDLVLAMIPVFRQDSSVSSRFINDLISLSVDDLQENFKSFLQGISTKNAAQVYTSFNKIAEIITAKTDDQRNDQSAKMFDEIFMEIRNHLKAAKSYHSFGAIRSINVASQMKHKEMINKISLNDYISSAIENFGHTQESMDKCLAKKPQSIPQCIAESSKYLWRTYSTLKAAKDILVDVGQGESLSEQAKMETVKARDYVAELFFIFKKNKKDLPSEYFSAMAYKEDIQLEEEGKNEMKAKTYKATELLKKFMKCDSGDSCMKKVSDAVVEYAKSMLAYQDKNSAWKKVILDKVINKHYFDYVTEPKDKIVNCYKDFLLGIKDPCQIKANTKDKATV